MNLKRENTEIFDQKHQMYAEGSCDDEPSKSEVVEFIKSIGWAASCVKIDYDVFQKVWRFTCDISPVTDTAEGIMQKALNKHCSPYGKPNLETYAFIDGYNQAMEEHRTSGNGWVCKEFSCDLITHLENIPQNRPLYKDSGLWQVRSDDMEDVIFQQGANESFPVFIKRVFDNGNSFDNA